MTDEEDTRNEGDLPPVEVADDELVDPDDTDTSVEDDTLDSEPTGERTVPYERFKEKVDEANDLKAKYAAATAPKEENSSREKSPSKVYSDEQVETIKSLAGTKELQAKIDEQEQRWREKEEEEQRRADDRERQEAVSNKDLNPYGFSDTQVQKQVVKWGNSTNPDKRWLAQASYNRIISEMNEIYKARESKKGEAPPKVESSGTAGARTPDAPQDNRTDASNPLSYKMSLAQRANEYMKSLEGGDSE